MPDKFFLSASGADLVGELQASLHSERLLWSGRCAVAEYAFAEPASLPRWTLPEETEVVVTETRVAFLHRAGQIGGELHWTWPQHLRVQPGNRNTGRSATVTQIQLVCAGPAGAFPALVFAGGDLATVTDADRLANVLRQAIARFRVEHTAELGLTLPQSRILSRLVIGPEFSNYQGGEGQTVSLLGAWPVYLPTAEAPVLDDYVPAYALDHYAPEQADLPAYPPGSYDSASPGPEAYAPSDSYWASAPVPDPYADPYAPLVDPAAAVSYPSASYPSASAPDWSAGQARRADLAHPDLASRAAGLAARVASLISDGAGLDLSTDRYETRTADLSALLSPPDPYLSATEYRFGDDVPAAHDAGDGYDAGDGSDGSDRAEAMRRTAARFAGNSARARGTAPRRTDDDLGAPFRGHRKG